VNTQTTTYVAGIAGVNVGTYAQYVLINANGQLGTAATNITSINPGKMNDAIAKLEARNTKLEASNSKLETTLAEQQQEIKDLTASLKQQASLLQKVSAQMQVMRSASQVVSNN